MTWGFLPMRVFSARFCTFAIWLCHWISVMNTNQSNRAGYLNSISIIHELFNLWHYDVIPWKICVWLFLIAWLGACYWFLQGIWSPLNPTKIPWALENSSPNLNFLDRCSLDYFSPIKEFQKSISYKMANAWKFESRVWVIRIKLSVPFFLGILYLFSVWSFILWKPKEWLGWKLREHVDCQKTRPYLWWI